MRGRKAFLTALLGTLLLAVPAQSQAFFGFFGGGFSFGFGGGWGGWGGPGWWGPGYWGGPGYYWHRPYSWRYWHRPYFWRHYRPYLWSYPFHGLTLPYAYVPQVVVPTVQAPATSKEK